MDPTSREDELGPLPKADRNAELQRRSIAAFGASLPTDKFLFRDERADDAGVDGSLELLIDGSYTNLRAQVQLKSTDSPEVNQDGTISLSVKTANLNYLLNGQSGLYVLYVVPRNELRFAWARDEHRRLYQTNLKWMGQETVTIRFEHLLTPAALEQMHERIRQEAQLHRSIFDMLGRASTGEQVVTSIDPETLTNTDPDELFQMLLAGGLMMVSAGYAEQVKELLGILKPAAARSPRIRLVRAYADYATGRYQAALAQLAEVALDRDELTVDEQQLLIYVQDACAYQTGQIDPGEYLKRLEEQTGGLAQGINTSYTLSRLRVALFNETDVAGRATILDEMRAAVAHVLAEAGIAEGFKLHARLVLLESEGHQSLLTSLEEMQQTRLRRKLGQEIDVAALLRAQRDRWASWERSADAMLQEAVALTNPLLVADALAIRASTRAMHLLNARLVTPLFDIPSDLPEDVILPPRRDAEQAIAIYSQANQLEGELRARMTLADLLTVVDRVTEAQELAREVLPKAQAMNYAGIEWRARMHLDGRTILSIYTARSEAEQTEDMDFRLADADSDTLKAFARKVLKVHDLPEDRLPVLEREWQSYKDIASERLHWCRHINLLQQLQHTDHKSTHYRVDPERYCKCAKHNYQSTIGSTDWPTLIRAFKRAYCEGCPDRDPKSK